MARTDERFKTAFNGLLDRCAELRGNDKHLPSESVLAEELNVSRTIIRSALKELDKKGVIQWDGREKTVLRAPQNSDRFELAVRPPTPEELERRFFEWILRFDVPAGTALNLTKLAREFQVPAHVLQEFLASLSRFGLIQKRKRGGWELVGFTEEFAVELSDFRSVLELNAVTTVVRQEPSHEIWAKLADLKEKHIALERDVASRFHDFSALDKEFHEAINSVVENRFVGEFQRVISMIFHYHYQWEKNTEQVRNAAAIKEHLVLIRALESRDEDASRRAIAAHLNTAKRTLLASMRSHSFT